MDFENLKSHELMWLAENGLIEKGSVFQDQDLNKVIFTGKSFQDYDERKDLYFGLCVGDSWNLIGHYE